MPNLMRLSFAGSLVLTGLATLARAAGPDPSPGEGPFRPDPASVQRYGAGYRYPQAGWTVLHIEGEPYERGYQHGRLMAPEIARFVEALAAYRSAKAPTDAWRAVRLLANALFLRKFDAEYLEEMKGIADGAAAAGARFDGRPLDLLDIVTVNADIETSFLDGALDATATGLESKRFREPAEGAPIRPREGHCSAFAATGPATTDGQVVFGHITMWNLYHAYHYNVWLDIKPAHGHRVLMQTYPGGLMSGLDYYMNDRGLLVCETTLAQTTFDPNGLPLVDRIRRALQYADSIDGAVRILAEGNNGLYTNEWLLADTKTNEVAMYELGTHKTRLWRSGRKEWFGGTEGFYWGCNNAKDLQVRLETVPGLEGKPANAVFHPADRDRTWLQLFDRKKGSIDAGFGTLAFTTPPLAASHSLDAKFTTTALARDLTTWAKFGPPLGHAWEPTDGQRQQHPSIASLIANDWTLLRAHPPESGNPSQPIAVDLARIGHDHEGGATHDEPDRERPPAWRGTILPESDADTWLAAAFADYEKVVSLEQSLKARAKDGKPSAADRDRLDVALFGPTSRYLAALARRGGKDIPLSEIHADLRSDEWYDIAAGKGLLVLAELRKTMGDAAFLEFMDAFGRAHAGRPANTGDFFAAAEKAYGKPLGPVKADWLNGDALAKLGDDVRARHAAGRFWAVDSFERQLESTLIIYGTLAEADAQREAAETLRSKVASRFANILVSIKADKDVTDDDLKSNHLLLVGRPATNRVTDRLAGSLPVRFGPASFRLRDQVYAHPHTALATAGPNPLVKANDRSVVVLAGLGAEGTWQAIRRFPDSGPVHCEVYLMEAGTSPRSLVVPPGQSTGVVAR
jgi:hypothetical protein